MGVNKVVFGAVAIMDISDSTVTPDKLAKGTTAYDQSGEKITGTMEAASDPVLQTKTVTPSTSAQSVTPDSGYDGLSKVTVNAMPTATQATPSISVSSAGKITASATQTAGYVAAGTKTATKQMTVQAAQTITPGTSNKTIASGRYLTGTQTIKGDANLVAGNIKSGVSIFGVTGSYEGSGGGGASGGGFETCQVTIVQEWGMNDDPELLHLYVPYYNVLSDGGIEQSFVYLSSADDYEPQHSITFTALKNIPITILARTAFATDIRYTASANGGTAVSHDLDFNSGGEFHSLTPTADTVIFTFASP